MNYLTTSKVIGYLTIIFVAGGATGAVVALNRTREREVQARSVEKACNRLQDRLVTRLSLTPTQIQKFQPVFDQSAADLRAVHAKAIRETDHIICRVHEQIISDLTAEQKAQLATLDVERRDWLSRRLKECEPPKEQ